MFIVNPGEGALTFIKPVCKQVRGLDAVTLNKPV